MFGKKQKGIPLQNTEENIISNKVNFDLECDYYIELSSIFESFDRLFVSPYNSLFFVVQRQRKLINVFQVTRLFQYQNKKLEEFKNKNPVYVDLRTRSIEKCIFLKNNQEFITIGGSGLEFCTIYKQEWKINQTIKYQILFHEIALKDDQTLYACGEKIFIFKRQNIWFLSASIEFNHAMSLKFSQFQFACTFYDKLLIVKQHNLKKILQISIINRRDYDYLKIQEFTQDGFILTDSHIIHWNQRMNKIIRRYQVQHDDKKPYCLSYNKASKIITYKVEEYLIISIFLNGEFKMVQKIKIQPQNPMLGNNGRLIIDQGEKKLRLYQSKI